MTTNKTLPEKANIPNNNHGKPNQDKENKMDNVETKKTDTVEPQKSGMSDKPVDKTKDKNFDTTVESSANNNDKKHNVIESKLTHPHDGNDHKA